MRVALYILLGILFILKAGLDWIELQEELREMHGEEDEQREDDCTGTAGSHTREDM